MISTKFLRSGIAALAFVAAGPGSALAQTPNCVNGTTTGYLTAANIEKLLSTNTACVGSAPVFGNQEYHVKTSASGGTVTELGGGAHQIGTYQMTSELTTGNIHPAFITYTYFSTPVTYKWAVLGTTTTPGAYYFCAVTGTSQSGSYIAVNVVSGQTNCS